MILPVPQNLVVCLGGLFGAMVGSFLNVCIYRLPLGMSVGKPVRSFCPGCKKTIPWFWNIPVVSWVLLGGKCAECRQAISPRYIGVEILTAALFGGVVWRFWGSAPSLILPYCLWVSLLIVATFVDLEHMIIPDEITLGGVAAGLVLSACIPAMHGSDTVWGSLLQAILGAGIGYGVLWGVVELGRLAFGRQKLTFDKPVEVSWTREGDAAALVLEGESLDWSSFFPRGTEAVHMEFEEAQMDGQSVPGPSATWNFESARFGDSIVDLNAACHFTARVRALVLPREVMGFGDVKFLAAVGAFTGWKSVFFTLLSGSIAGALLGVLAIVAGRREASGRIPFGPYLALGALLWLAVGDAVWQAYWSFLRSAPGSGSL